MDSQNNTPAVPAAQETTNEPRRSNTQGPKAPAFHAEAERRLNLNDEFGILATPNENIPYIGIKLTEEEARMVETKIMEFYVCDGKTIFQLKDGKGNKTGEVMFFVMFTDFHQDRRVI